MSKLKSTTESSATELKFAADRMLGKLAKWLRIMGQDVIYGQHLSGYGLIHTARMEHRLLLTRDRKLKKKQPPDFLFIESDHYREQLRQVIQTCGLSPLDRPFSRCLECNLILQPRSKAAIEKNRSGLCLFDPGKLLWVSEMPPRLLAGHASSTYDRRTSRISSPAT